MNRSTLVAFVLAPTLAASVCHAEHIHLVSSSGGCRVTNGNEVGNGRLPISNVVTLSGDNALRDVIVSGAFSDGWWVRNNNTSRGIQATIVIPLQGGAFRSVVADLAPGEVRTIVMSKRETAWIPRLTGARYTN